MVMPRNLNSIILNSVTFCTDLFLVSFCPRRRCEAQKQDLDERLDYMTKQFDALSEEIKSKILKFSEEVEHQVRNYGHQHSFPRQSRQMQVDAMRNRKM